LNYTQQFVESVKNGVIPEEPPIESLESLYPFPIGASDQIMFSFEAREECTKRGMWAIIDKKWTKKLAQWIDNRKCLEVMSGTGWLSYALNHYGIDIIATDNGAWKKAYSDARSMFPVQNIEATEAVKKYKDREILIVSWPPYNDKTICKVCKIWGKSKPIVYIGEERWGCCAPEIFWDHFRKIDDQPQIEIPQWRGMHDYLAIGYWE